jgi:hypothetical protein
MLSSRLALVFFAAASPLVLSASVGASHFLKLRAANSNIRTPP